MLNRLKSEDEGFTLIELLVVILIIGILAAIALPSFLNQQNKGKDAGAKSDVRNAVSLMESCATDTGGKYDAVSCPPLTEVFKDSNIKTNATGTGAPAAGETTVFAQAATGYTVSTKSDSGTFFNITRSNVSGAVVQYRCKGAAAAACASNSW